MAKIIHVCFEVSDLERSIAFYTEAFGLGLADRQNALYGEERLSLAYLRCPETSMEIELLQWLDRPGVPAKDKRETHVAVAVDDLAAEHRRLKRLTKDMDATITTHAPDGQVAGRFFFVHDPDGNAIEVFQRGGRYQ